MRGSRFKADGIGAAWLTPVDCRELAKLCEGAGLSALQAEVVRLTTARYSHAEMECLLSLAEGKAREIAVQAEWRIRRRQSWIPGTLTREMVDVLKCLRNTFNACPRAAVYRRIAGGCYDTDPVRFRSRLYGERPEDRTHEEGYLLRSLPRLLKDRRTSRQPEADSR